MSFGLSLVNSVGYILPFFTRKNMLHSVKHFFITLRWRLVLLNIDSCLLFSTISIVSDSELGCAQINNYHICSWDEFLRSRMPLFFLFQCGFYCSFQYYCCLRKRRLCHFLRIQTQSGLFSCRISPVSIQFTFIIWKCIHEM